MKQTRVGCNTDETALLTMIAQSQAQQQQQQQQQQRERNVPRTQRITVHLMMNFSLKTLPNRGARRHHHRLRLLLSTVPRSAAPRLWCQARGLVLRSAVLWISRRAMGTVRMPESRMSAKRLEEVLPTTTNAAMQRAAAMMRAGPWTVKP